MPADVIPGAEGWAAAGGPAGALVVHGFTGTPATVRPVAEALVDAGFSVAVPRLPGHGTAIADMVPTRFTDWSAAVEDAYVTLARSCSRVVVVGQSMGATLACRLAARHPEIAGVVAVNPLVEPVDPELKELVQLLLDAGEVVGAGTGRDLADPNATDIAYWGSPLAAALSLYEALDDLQPELARIACPVLIITSAEDHVVPPRNSDSLAALVHGPVERLRLERSYHVATLDHDKDLLAARTWPSSAGSPRERAAQEGERRRSPGRPSKRWWRVERRMRLWCKTVAAMRASAVWMPAARRRRPARSATARSMGSSGNEPSSRRSFSSSARAPA